MGELGKLRQECNDWERELDKKEANLNELVMRRQRRARTMKSLEDCLRKMECVVSKLEKGQGPDTPSITGELVKAKTVYQRIAEEADHIEDICQGPETLTAASMAVAYVQGCVEELETVFDDVEQRQKRAALEKRRRLDILEAERRMYENGRYYEETRYVNGRVAGIIGHLSCRHEVTITASSTYGMVLPQQVVSGENGSCWYSENYPRSWIMFDCGMKWVCPTHYMLKSCMPCYPRIWEVTGSDDGSSWMVLDRRETDDLSQDTVSVFSCETTTNRRPFRYVRFTQMGSNASDNDSFVLNRVELFGTVQPQE